MSLDSHLARHHGIVDLATLARLGYTREFAYAQVAARRWQRVYRAVFCGYTGPLTFESRCAAALLVTGPEAALDAATAAYLYGLRGLEHDAIEVVVAGDRHPRSRPGLVVRRSRTWTPCAAVVRRGLRVVSVERSVLTLALTRRRYDVVTVAVQQGLTTPARLRGALAGLGRVDGARAVLAALDDADGGSRSWLESRFRRLIRSAGLPAPVQNHPLRLGDRLVRLDACYPRHRVAIELDGRAYHLASGDWEADLDRQNAIVLDGWTVLRFTARDLRERPDAVVEAVRLALASSSRGPSVAS